MIYQPGSGLDKRQATIQLCIRACDKQIVRIAIIFRGQGLRLSQEELQFYAALDPRIRVYFQPKAWADSQICLAWLEDFAADTAELRAEYGEVLLGMDNLSSQQSLPMRSRMAELGIIAAFTPPDCTDLVAPVDHNVGALLKHLMSIFYHETLAANQDDWMNNSVSASERRMLMAGWLVDSWEILQKYPRVLKQAFVRTGFLLAQAGVHESEETHLIEVPVLKDQGEDYHFAGDSDAEDYDSGSDDDEFDSDVEHVVGAIEMDNEYDDTAE